MTIKSLQQTEQMERKEVRREKKKRPQQFTFGRIITEQNLNLLILHTWIIEPPLLNKCNTGFA